MDQNLEDAAVIHNEKAHRFDATVDGLRAFLTYRHPETQDLVSAEHLQRILSRSRNVASS